MPTREDYQRAFATERANIYPSVDAFEARVRFSIDRAHLEEMARVLACPVKANPPNWQHGRVLYAEARRYIDTIGALPGSRSQPLTFVDIGTAKGFSALCLAWAIADAGKVGKVLSYDVIEPLSNEPRNSIRDLEEDRPNVHELTAPLKPKNVPVLFFGGNARPQAQGRINVAFIDGKHNYVSVKNDALALRSRQWVGDVIIFDDVNIEGVARAVMDCMEGYEVESLEVLPGRRYAIARRK